MSPVIVAFPPAAGGNHLKNLIDDRAESDAVTKLYTKSQTAHSQPGCNFSEDNLINFGITHGHFGEILSHQSLLRSIEDKKFIIISPDTPRDRELLFQRRIMLGGAYNHLLFGHYFDGEQVFLYEPFMYHYYFGTSFDNIMNISISEWFCQDITGVLNRISYFLNKPLDIEKCLELHRMWCESNLIEN